LKSVLQKKWITPGDLK
jgi:hypothetical protein